MRAPSPTSLRSVVLPILAEDIAQNLPRTFQLWSDPRAFPLMATRAPQQRLIVVVNRATAEQLEEIITIYQRYPLLALCFTGVECVNAGLTGERDLYARGSAVPLGRYGNKAGPNFLFEAAMKAAEPAGGFTFQMELDCLPVQAGWIEQLEEIVAGNSRAWVIGSVFAGERGLGKIVQGHLNGNALYRVGDPAFQDFLDREWMPGLAAAVADTPNLAYDCWWARETQLADPHVGNAAWRRWRLFDGYFRNDSVLLNFLGTGAEVQEARRWFEEMAMVGRPPIFLHGPAMQRILPIMLQDPDIGLLEALDRLRAPEAEISFQFRGARADLATLSAAGFDADLGLAVRTSDARIFLLTMTSRLILHPTETYAALEHGLADRLKAALLDPAVSEPVRSCFVRAWQSAAQQGA